MEEYERFDLHLDGFDVKRGLFAKLVPCYLDVFASASAGVSADEHFIFNNEVSRILLVTGAAFRVDFDKLDGAAAKKAMTKKLRAHYRMHKVKGMVLLHSLRCLA